MLELTPHASYTRSPAIRREDLEFLPIFRRGSELANTLIYLVYLFCREVPLNENRRLHSVRLLRPVSTFYFTIFSVEVAT